MLVLVFTSLVGTVLCRAAPADAPAARGYVGITAQQTNGSLTIDRVLENSPAKRAGLVGGEQILKVNGVDVRDKSPREAAGLMLGPAGEKVILTLVRPGSSNAQPFEVVLVRDPIPANLMARGGSGRAVKASWSRPPTREAGPVEWKGDKIVSRVLPYTDFVSLFIRLPIAHAAALGTGVKVGVLQSGEQKDAQILVENVAPRAQVETFQIQSNTVPDAVRALMGKGIRVVLIPEPRSWPDLEGLVKQLLSKDILAVLPSDLSEEAGAIESINRAQAAGALTVGRVDRQSLVLKGIEGDGGTPFNKRIMEIKTDVFSSVGVDPGAPPVIAAATAAGVAALNLERSPKLTAHELCQRIIAGARPVWQMVVKDTRQPRELPFTVDPVTTEFKVKNPTGAFRFRALDAAGCLGVETEIPWFLNALNCKKAWEITRGKGVRAVITDQGFHIRHPELVHRIESTRHFGWLTFESPDQNFHGTDMSRIFLAIAPEAKIIPVLCSGQRGDEHVKNIAESFRYAAETKVDVVSGSWAGWFNTDQNLLEAVQAAVKAGVVASWFHYPKPYPGVLRPTFTYAAGWDPEPRVAFLDRFTTDPPGFHPVEIEAGLSVTAPQAAGIAALVKSVNPKLTPAQVENLIMKHSTPIGGGVLVPDAWEIVRAAGAAEPSTLPRN